MFLFVSEAITSFTANACIWYMLGWGRSKPSLGSFGICWGAEQAFTREFGCMLGVWQSKPSLGSLGCVGRGEEQALTRVGICWVEGRASLH